MLGKVAWLCMRNGDASMFHWVTAACRGAADARVRTPAAKHPSRGLMEKKHTATAMELNACKLGAVIV